MELLLDAVGNAGIESVPSFLHAGNGGQEVADVLGMMVWCEKSIWQTYQLLEARDGI